MSDENLIGKKFNKLTIIGFSRIGNHCYLNVICDCGNKTKTYLSSLVKGKTKSCGCLIKEISRKRMTTHNLHGTPIYSSWHNMIQRCTNVNSQSYSYYGGRGITVCDKWLTFEGFYEDMGDRPLNKSLDRKNNNGNYCKDNCKWSTREEQMNNVRTNMNLTFKGKTQSFSMWAKEFNINKSTLKERILTRKWTIEKALTAEVKKMKQFDEKLFIEKHSNGLGDSELCKIFKVTAKTIRKYREKLNLKVNRKIITVNENEKRMELYNNGNSDCKIAEKCNVGRYTILRWRKAQNLPANISV